MLRNEPTMTNHPSFSSPLRNEGLIPRSLRYILGEMATSADFKRVFASKAPEGTHLEMSFLELYKDDVHDLWSDAMGQTRPNAKG